MDTFVYICIMAKRKTDNRVVTKRSTERYVWDEIKTDSYVWEKEKFVIDEWDKEQMEQIECMRRDFCASSHRQDITIKDTVRNMVDFAYKFMPHKIIRDKYL